MKKLIALRRADQRTQQLKKKMGFHFQLLKLQWENFLGDKRSCNLECSAEVNTSHYICSPCTLNILTWSEHPIKAGYAKTESDRSRLVVSCYWNGIWDLINTRWVSWVKGFDAKTSEIALTMHPRVRKMYFKTKLSISTGRIGIYTQWRFCHC